MGLDKGDLFEPAGEMNFLAHIVGGHRAVI
jgi:hypothetical protein